MTSTMAELLADPERRLGPPDDEPVIVGPGRRADVQSGDGFRRYRTGISDITALLRRDDDDTKVKVELMPVVERLNRRPAGDFASVDDLYAGLGDRTRSQPSAAATRFLRNCFLDHVDLRLQALYRSHFRANPHLAAERHDARVASLQATRAEAQAIVASYDWHWLEQWLRLARIDRDARTCLRRLSNYAFKVRRVNFRFTHHCNIACRHCYNDSGPDKKAQRIALEPMLAIVAQMPAAGIGHLNLTGGEPFLYPDQVMATVEAARAAGLSCISIFSNGFWALGGERTNAMLRRLAAAGFMREPADYMKVSTGSFHREFIDFERVLSLARDFHAMFGRKLRVDYALAPRDAGRAAEIRSRVSAAGLDDSMTLSFRGVSPLGRARDLEGIAPQMKDAPCRVINQISFEPDGAARPCCGLNNENQGVVIGRLDAHRLPALVKRMQNDPVLQFLSRNRMSAIFEHVPASKRPGGYASNCHLCQHALGAVDDKEALQARLSSRQSFYPFWFALTAGEQIRIPVEREPADEID